jgi:hypothetical protein
MRVPVYPRGANPRTSRCILRKKLSYAEDEVSALRADWADSFDHSKGIVPREFLASGKVYAATPEQIERIASPPPDAGLKFIPPASFKNPTLPRINIQSLLESAPNWDWTGVPA